MYQLAFMAVYVLESPTGSSLQPGWNTYDVHSEKPNWPPMIDPSALYIGTADWIRAPLAACEAR